MREWAITVVLIIISVNVRVLKNPPKRGFQAIPRHRRGKEANEKTLKTYSSLPILAISKPYGFRNAHKELLWDKYITGNFGVNIAFLLISFYNIIIVKKGMKINFNKEPETKLCI